MYALTLADAERANNRPADGVRIRSGHWETARRNDRAKKLRQIKIRNARRTKSQRLGWTA